MQSTIWRSSLKRRMCGDGWFGLWSNFASVTACATDEGHLMGYDWNGSRGRRMKIARFGTAVALAALPFAAPSVTSALRAL